MTLRFRHLRLRAETGRGRFGVDVPMQDGLMIIRADNSRGKSTAVQSLLFALGLEKMIATRPTQAVTSAMRDRLIYDPATKGETPVLSSWVSVQIENNRGDVATVTRWVKHNSIGTSLVRVALGPSLTSIGDFPTVDMYVGRPGAAGNPRGFHRWLADFIGWEMPDLPASDGRLSPLYIEQVFPLLFVEQRRGWGGIQAQMPYFSGVSEVRRRAIEFLLNLDVGKLETQRLVFRAKERELQQEWRNATTAFNESLRGTGLLTTRLPDKLPSAWPPPDAPLVIESREAGWIPLDDLLAQLNSELELLSIEKIAGLGDSAPAAELRLAEEVTEATRLRAESALIREDLFRDQTEIRGVHARLAALREDLREHQDLVTLERLGSTEIERFSGDCPVCHQELPESLLGSDRPVHTLSPEDSVKYIRQQIELFEAMERDVDRTIRAKSEQLAAIRSRAADARANIRAIRASLTLPTNIPSVEQVTNQVRLQERVDRLVVVRERFYELLGRLDRIADSAREVSAALDALPKDRLSGDDVRKLNKLQASFVEQLHSYDFGSFSDERLYISQEDYLPRREEFDLQADISASDSIRVIWAYLLGMIDVSVTELTNHPGLVVFDEPRQQSAKALSFEALLRRASQLADGRQIIFATSEELGSIRRMLDGLRHTLYPISGYVLKPVAN